MNEKVQEYIERKTKMRNKEKYDLLIKEGLFDKVYPPDEDFGSESEYPESEWDNKLHIYRSYKKVPIQITDEEYELIKNLSEV